MKKALGIAGLCVGLLSGCSAVPVTKAHTKTTNDRCIEELANTLACANSQRKYRMIVEMEGVRTTLGACGYTKELSYENTREAVTAAMYLTYPELWDLQKMAEEKLDYNNPITRIRAEELIDALKKRGLNLMDLKNHMIDYGNKEGLFFDDYKPKPVIKI